MLQNTEDRLPATENMQEDQIDVQKDQICENYVVYCVAICF